MAYSFNRKNQATTKTPLYNQSSKHSIKFINANLTSATDLVIGLQNLYGIAGQNFNPETVIRESTETIEED